MRCQWKSASIGQRTTVKLELVDLYKTLADLASLPMSAVQPSVQGLSLARVFDAPANIPAPLQQKAAFSQIGRCNCGVYHTRDGAIQECGGNACCQIPITCAKDADPEVCDRDANQSHWNMNSVGTYDYMGYSMRTKTWRFTACESASISLKMLSNAFATLMITSVCVVRASIQRHQRASAVA